MIPSINKDINLERIRTKRSLDNATSGHTHRLWTRAVIIIAISIIAYFYTHSNVDNNTLGKTSENLPLRSQKFSCSPSYDSEVHKYKNCIPKRCGRFVSDQLVESGEADLLRQLAESVISKAGSSGGASILDIHSGALSYEDKFLNVYEVPQLLSQFEESHFRVYNFVKSKIQQSIAEQFGISSQSLHLTYPTFFSRITNSTAKTKHDEYWHEHVDKDTYSSFHYTSLLYLNTYGEDFKGGRFLFVEHNGKKRTTMAVEPKKGRLNAFTSGEENRHYIEKVSEGERFAITIAFTCNSQMAISDPQIPEHVIKS